MPSINAYDILSYAGTEKSDNWTQRQTHKENNEMTEAEIGVRYLEAKECQGLRATPKTKRNVWSRVSPWSSQRR